MSAVPQNDLPLVDEAYLRSVQEAVGEAAMVGLIESMLKDARRTADLLASALAREGEKGQAREAHRLGGLFAQFGCPAVAQALKNAAHADLGMIGVGIESALVLVEPTVAELSALFDAENS